MSAPDRPPFRRVLAEFRPHSRVAGKAAAGAAVGTALTIAGPLVIKLVVDEGLRGKSLLWVLIGTAIYGLASIGTAIAGYFEIKSAGRLAQDYMRALRGRLLDHLFFLDLDFFTRERSGRLVSRLTSDVENLQQFVGSGISLVLRAVLMITVTITLMFSLSWRLTLAALLVVPILVGAGVWFRRTAYKAQIDVRDRMSNMLTRLNESLVGMRVVQAYNVEEQQREAFEEVNLDTYSSKMHAAKASISFYALVEVLRPIALSLVLGYGTWLAVRGQVTAGTVVAFTLYVARLFEPIVQFTELAQLIQSAAASFAKVFAFRDERPLVYDAPFAAPIVPGSGEIRFEHVSFRYAPTAPRVIHDVNFVVRPGERIALVGGSGAGKSTVAKLMARFYDPTEGRVIVDGQDLRAVTSESLRKHLALVPQEGFLFDGTVGDNIAAAAPDASADRIEQACRALGIYERMQALPQGLDTVVTNRGLSLSAGQRQLVALGRAFLADPKIILLDEATSNVDPATEALLEEALRTLLADKTAIVIAHRVHTALRADRVVMLDHGRIAEVGSPTEMILAGGAFARWARQATDAAV